MLHDTQVPAPRFLVPGNLGESYIKKQAGSYSVSSQLYAASFYSVIVGWLCDRSNGSVNHKETIAITFSLAVAATVFGWIGVMIVGGILDRSGER
jgi:hypothetical protein